MAHQVGKFQGFVNHPNRSRSTDLEDADAPEKVANILRNAAEKFRDSESELQSAWQDPNTGRVWREIAKALERAAVSCERVCNRYA